MKDTSKRHWYDLNIFSGLIGAIITLIATTIVNRYIVVDNVNVLIKTTLVDSGLVSEEILNEDLKTQFEDIANAISENKIVLVNFRNDLQTTLVNNGTEESQLAGMQAEDMISLLDDERDALKKENDNLKEEIDKLEEENENYSLENEKLSNQITAEIKSASLIIDGEEIDADIPNSVVIADNKVFYSETLLNSFFDEKISFNSLDSIVSVGEQKAEKVMFQNSLITNTDGFNIYSVGDGKAFLMGTDTYDNGFITSRIPSGGTAYFYANLKGEYASMSFVVGHIDGTGLNNRTLYIYTKNGNDEYRILETINLTSDMFPEEISININYADGIQFVFDGNYSAQYGIADIYLYR